MRTDEELITERNMQVIAKALLDTMNVFCEIEGCENLYIRAIGKSLIDKYGEILKDIADNGNSV